ncbi:T9SS type A sorting domain-containing protein [Flavobacterium sp. ST-75]|uniref:T9SS type A sorting domain-containing protein n=1 Tax=Flavobacterium rhizophilum TaxID=3163296 RepID=A0ABW8Y9Y3_9FLAO
MTVRDINFGAQSLSVTEFETLHTNIFNYPNPFKGSTIVVLPEDTEVKHITFTDMLGRTIVSSGYKKQTSGKELLLANINLPEGIYMINVATVDGKVCQTRCVVK